MYRNWKILSLTALIGSGLMVSCQGTAVDNNEATASTAESDSLISVFPLQESILTASESYRITSSDDPTVSYLTLSTSVQWPESLGKHDISNLRDSIINFTFGGDAPRDLKEAIKASVTDVASFGIGGKAEKIASVPDSAGTLAYYSDRSLQLVECTDQTVTYSASWGEYLGGAHPNSGARPFSFVLESDCMVTMDYLFIKGYEKVLMPKIFEALALEHSLTVQELQGTLLGSPSAVTDNVYLLNNAIAFHYNPYEILPYSFGASDIYIIPYEVADILTPEAKKLLLD